MEQIRRVNEILGHGGSFSVAQSRFIRHQLIDQFSGMRQQDFILITTCKLVSAADMNSPRHFILCGQVSLPKSKPSKL